MLPLKRLIYIIFFVILISSVFMIYNINTERSHAVDIVHVETEQMELLGTEQDIGSKPRKYLLVGDSKKQLYGNILQNAEQLLKDWKVGYAKVDGTKFNTETLTNNEIVIFCDDIASAYVDLKDLGEYISKGGRVIFAAGIAEGHQDSYLLPFMGISEKSTKTVSSNFQFMDNLLPLQKESLQYAGYNASTRLALRDSVKVYIKDNETGNPILFTYSYGDGTSCVINGNLLADFNSCGLLSGSIALLEEVLIYPVLGVRCIYLDNFPMVTYLNDIRCMKLYGRTTESFVRDVVWPVFQGMSLRQSTPYTSSVLVAGPNESTFPEVSESLFVTIGKSALQYGGELAYAVNMGETESLWVNRKFIEEFQSVFKNYTVRSLVLNSPDVVDSVTDWAPDTIEAVRGHMSSQDGRFRFSYNKDWFSFPVATFGNQMENGNLFESMSIVSAYGMISHVFDVNGMVSQNDEVGMWDLDKKEIAVFEQELLSKTPYLEGMTLSQTKNKVNSFVNLDFSYDISKNKVEIRAKNFVKGQTFFMKFDGEIKAATGLSYKDIGKNYYILSLQDTNAVIELEAR